MTDPLFVNVDALMRYEPSEECFQRGFEESWGGEWMKEQLAFVFRHVPTVLDDLDRFTEELMAALEREPSA